ncbi:LamG domain-containing protein [Streptomyces canus]|uniref:LamG domain-containing protein n=1 Tax=Streptomyces canus TaxID=58343 RepID=UPI00224E030A|nr:LamG domain-containing protein [Streptomyces canus]MCX4855674.1 LamG domain-containing protein [Streptomyces canus]WSW38957.1 LamG domain-containing protein [Streptomyces canus]
MGERTEYTTTFANPDGVTFTLKDSAVPVRVKKPDGSWTAPDATLEHRSDGTVGPKASVADVSFSGGGDGSDLVKLSLNGRSLTVGWPGTLPAPALDGASAVYADVLPGVDLQLSATTEGYREVLIVNSVSAAANPELKELSFPVKASGLSLQDGPSGGLTAVDGNGNAVFSAPAAQQWDSAGDASTSASASSAALTTSGAATSSVTRASFTTAEMASATAATSADGTVAGDGEATPDPTEGPSDGDASSVLPVTADKDTISVTPDASMLADESAAFPQYIDPDVGMTASERTLLSSDGDTFYNFSGGDDGKGVGYCGTYVTGGVGYYCGSGYKNRMYFEFSPAKLAGKQVLDATFVITEKWSMSCTPSWVDLVRTGNISSSTNWPGPTANWDLMVDRYVSAGRGSACNPSQPAADIEFNDNPDETNENLTSTMKKFANGDFSRLTLMLKAHDETDPNSWKRFDDNAEIDVKYVGIPAKPTKIGLVTGTTVACETDKSDPLVVSDPTPALQSTPQTAPGGESGATLKAVYSVDKYTASSDTWSTVFETARPTSGYVGDNVSPGSVPTSTLSEGTLYRYRSWTRSYYNSGDSYLAGPSNGSTTGWCYFKVDPTRPKAPGVTLSSPYSACTTDSCTAAGGPGTKVTFTFKPAAGDTSNTGYEYKTTSSAAWSAPITGSTVTATFTPPTSGTYSVFVRAEDSLGWGAQSAVDFLVAEGSGPIGQWHFDEASGAALDSSTTTTTQQDNATLSATGASRDSRGRRGVVTKNAAGEDLATPQTDTGLTLNGTSGYAATSGPVIETRSSYTISAWARIASAPTSNVVVASQTGTGSNGPGFSLYYSTAYGKWIFGWHWADSSGTWHYLRSLADAAAPPVKVWTHLAGVYDADAGTIQLYVNGKPQGAPVAMPSGEPEAGNGALQFGRGNGSTAGSFAGYFNGQIDEVRIWQRALSQQAVSDESRLLTNSAYAGAELVAAWDPSAATGTSVPDATSGYGTGLALSGGASLDGTGIVLDGTDDAATAAGPLVDDTGSFTATTAVQLDSTALAAKPVGYLGQVIGQRSSDGSSWGLWYKLTGTEPDPETDSTIPVGLWQFGRLNADGSFTGVVSDSTADLGSAVRLTGIFDAQAGTISLYVGDAQNGDAKTYTAVAGTGDFAAGKAFVSSAWGHYLPATISDIRLWAGAMASQEQIINTVGD